MPGPGGAGRPGGGFAARSFLTEEEKANAPKVTRGLLLRIAGYLRPYWPQLLAVFAAILVGAVVGLLPSIITGRIVDEALAGDDLSYLVRLLLTALAAMFASQLVGVLENYINSWIGQRIIFDMKNEMYAHLQGMPHAFFTTEKQGDIVTRMNTDISGVSSVISDTLTQVVSNVATVAATVVALFSMSPMLAAVGMLVLPLLIVPTRSAGRVRLRLVQESQAKSDEMNQLLSETLSVSGSLLTKMFTAEAREYERFVGVNEEVTELALREQRSGSWFRVVMGMFMQLGPLLIYFAGGYLIIRRLDPTLTVGTITATVTLVNRLYRPVESLLNLQVSFTRSLAMFVRIFDYLDRPATIVSPEHGKRPSCEQAEIVYEHVAFGYDLPADAVEGGRHIVATDVPTDTDIDRSSPDLVLRDVSFTVPGGQMYAIVGPSGSGKSTVVNLIPRLYDVVAGSVRVAGVDVREFDLSYLRGCVGVVTQEAYLFNGSILENLRYAKPDATQEEIEAACRVANIHEFIERQPDGYDTQVGNRGLKLSGGEKQRLSLARVVLKDPRILILDEATSALDSISESAIQEALEQLMVGRTSIVIAHRLSTILKADRILVVKDGVIAEQGTHAELLAAGGVYRELYETQFRQVIEGERSTRAGADGGAGEISRLDIQALATGYDVRRITEADITDVYLLAKANRQYYAYLHAKPTMAGLTEVISEVPEGTDLRDKYFVGFYAADGTGAAGVVSDRATGNAELIAIMDLITGYPEDDDAFIGWFMVDIDHQRRGVGSSIFADVRAALSAQGYDHLELAVITENVEADGFWRAQGFAPTGRVVDKGDYSVAVYARDI